ncbi:MAG TPA: GGDEF domain-containing protein, partial [Rhodanobacteraceae bacterium]|nr:GGDEF domain-containing protein [Rhodanobacteraceae bacterium]
MADSTAPTFTVYSGRDGLDDEIWSTVGFDKRGFVWAGSASSLARFDGYRWQMWPLPHAHSLVRDMQTAADGTLWAIFEREGLARYDGHAWTFVGKPHFFQRFSSVRTRHGPDLWAAREDGLMHLRNGVWTGDPGNAMFGAIRPNAFAQTNTLFGGVRQWFGGSGGGLWYRTLGADARPGPWRRFDRLQVNDMPVTDLMASINDAGQEELWVLSYGGGLARIRADGIRVWRSDTGELPSEALYSIAETHTAGGERRLWIASRGGLLRIRGDGHIDVFDRRNGLPSNAVRGVKVQHGADGIDVLWLATEGGVVRAVLNDSPWQTVSLLGASFNGIFGLMLEPDGKGSERLWVGSAKEGLGLLDQGKWRMFTKENGALPTDSVRGIWRVPGADGKPHRLLGLQGAALLEIDDALHVVPLATPWPVRPDEGATMALGRTWKGAVEWWISTLHDGVYRRRDGKWTAYTAPGVAGPWSVFALAEQVDASGKSWLWAASSQGLARFDGERWQLLQGIPGLPADGYRSVTLFGKGKSQQLWASSNRHGVVRLDVGDPRKPRGLGDEGIPPLPDPTVYGVLHDSRGRVYICTNNGVQQLTPRPGGGYSQRVFHRRDGLVHDECNNGSQLIDGSDRYWVGTLGGLSMFDPDVRAVAATPRPKPLYFTSLGVDGKLRTLSDNVPLQLSADVRELQVDYTVLAGQREHETRYRSQLIGYEPAPTGWTDEHRRSFTGLPPGHYALRVEARDFNGTASVPRSLQFTIAPHWWQRRSLQAVLAGLAALGALAGVMTYNRGLRARQRQLRGEVAERTQALRVA